jgi:NADH-quinone oxidoreductase subunit E
MFQLSTQTLQAIEALLPKYPQKRSCILPILHLIQEEMGYVSKEAMEWVSFYLMFKQEKVGRQHIKVCRTLSCALKGSEAVCKLFQDRLSCPLGETTPDGAFTLEFVECLANCHEAPVVQVNEDLVSHCDLKKAEQLIQQLQS